MKLGKPYLRAEPGYNPRGGRPPLDVDFVAVCDAVREAWAGSGETVTSIAARFGVSRGGGFTSGFTRRFGCNSWHSTLLGWVRIFICILSYDLDTAI